MGKLCGKDIIAVRGKMFLLDGVPAQLIALPIRIAYTLGCRTLLYTNTAGAINPDYQPGDFVFLNNHINLTGSNPLVGERNGEWGPLFFDMTYPYDLGLRAAGEEVASRLGLLVQEGVYAALLGPSFETAAEIQMLAQVGADLVGMSTVMEVIAARQLGMRVLAVGFVSNMAAGLTTTLVENEEVQKTTSTRQEVYAALIKGIVERINV
jgi:purine-nucleoside phosphorylase